MPLQPVSTEQGPSNLQVEVLTANGPHRVILALAAGGPVLSVFGRTGNVVAANFAPPDQVPDYNTSQILNDTGLPPGPTLNTVLQFMAGELPPIMLSSTNGTGSTSPVYMQRAHGTPSSESTGTIHAARAGTLRQLSVQLLAPFSAATITFTVRINGLATALSVTLTPGQTFKSVEAFTSVTQGDRISLQATQSTNEAGTGCNPTCWIT